MEKDSNPKDAIGTAKWRQFFVVPMQVLWEVGVGMLEGSLKYGRHNYRGAGVRASVYVDAALGHIQQFVEGEDIDKDSGLSHITKAICSLFVLRDAQMNGFWTDDRPPQIKDMDALRDRLQALVVDNFERYADKDPHHYSEVEDGSPYNEVAEKREEEVKEAIFDDRSIDDICEFLGGFSGTAEIHRVGDVSKSTIRFRSVDPSIEACQAHLEDPTYLPKDVLPCLSDNDPSQILWMHEDHEDYDRAHIVEALTQKQFTRLMHREAETCGYVTDVHFGDEVFRDAIARRVLLRMAGRSRLWHTLVWENGRDRRYSRLRGSEWSIAIPDCIAIPDSMPRSFA